MVDAEDEGISQTPPDLNMLDLGEFNSQTSSSPELPTPSTPLTLTPTSSQQTSQPSQSSTASSGPSSIGDVDLSQDWDEVNRQIHKCTEKMEPRACIQNLETWVASLGDPPFRKKVQDFFLEGGEEWGELTQTAISFLSLRNKADLWARVQAQVGWEDTHDARQPVVEQLDMSRPWAHELLGPPSWAAEALVKKRYRKLVLWAQRFYISVIQRINGAKDILCGDSRRLYEAQLNGLVAPRGEDLGDDPTLLPREHVWWPSMADVESLEPMQAANPGTTAPHGPNSPDPTSISSQTVHPEYVDADDTPSPAEGPSSEVDGITIRAHLDQVPLNYPSETVVQPSSTAHFHYGIPTVEPPSWYSNKLLSSNLKTAIFQPCKRCHTPQKECFGKPSYLIGANHWRPFSLGSYFTAVVV